MTRVPAGVTAANLANYDSAWSVAHYGDELQGLFPAEERLLREWWPPPPARVLDLGCGAGRTTVELDRRGYRVVGIDVSSALLDRARARHPHLDVRRMDATALAFQDESFDAALFSFNGLDCLHPVTARQQCLHEVHRVLVPGGIFAFSTHNAIGALLSGGYFYVRGYYNALRWLARQRGNPHLRDWYWRYDDPGGVQLLYSAPPSRTDAQARAAGFDVLSVMGATGEIRPGRIRYREQHVYFVLRRR